MRESRPDPRDAKGDEVHAQPSGPHDPLWLQLARRFGFYAGLFLAGALLAFVYTYVPLHNAKNWKIDYLEERLAAKDDRLHLLEAQVADSSSAQAHAPDPETFKLLQAELVTADKTIKDLERRLTKSKKKAAELERSRSSWKKKFDAAEAAQSEQLASAAASAPPPASPASPSSGVPDDAQGGGPQPVDVDLHSDLANAEDTQGQ